MQVNVDSTEFKELYIKYLKEPVYRHGKVFQRYRGVEQFEKFEEYYRNISKLNDFGGDIWFISDHHFNHNNIIKFSERPFRDKEHMENVLVEQHNDMVKEDDIVILVGDFGFCNKNEGKRILARMNGYKILVVGNHDIHRGKFKDFGYDEVYVYLNISPLNIIITHFPFSGFDESYINIHGHIHKGIGYDSAEYNNHFNVNCEFINYTPIHITKILESFRIKGKT